VQYDVTNGRLPHTCQEPDNSFTPDTLQPLVLCLWFQRKTRRIGAHDTVRNIQWFTITETRGHVVDGKVAHWQVSLKIGFTLE